jgi:hypothetical protein
LDEATEEGKKGYIWVLSAAAVARGGVQSTTRFRTNKTSRKSSTGKTGTRRSRQRAKGRNLKAARAHRAPVRANQENQAASPVAATPFYIDNTRPPVTINESDLFQQQQPMHFQIGSPEGSYVNTPSSNHSSLPGYYEPDHSWHHITNATADLGNDALFYDAPPPSLPDRDGGRERDCFGGGSDMNFTHFGYYNPAYPSFMH